MDIRVKQRYNFVLSSFSRIYGVGKINTSIKYFCEEWSKLEVHAPLGSLNEVDQYFCNEYSNWKSRG